MAIIKKINIDNINYDIEDEAAIHENEIDNNTLIVSNNLLTVNTNVIQNKSIVDLDDHFTDKTVEGALDELFTSVSNGKATVASAITDKGVETPSDATFSTMATNIMAISSGGKPEISPTITLDLSEGDQIVPESDTYTYRSITISKPETLLANNIRQNVDIAGVTGTLVEGIVPTGNIQLTKQTSTDVTNYATATVRAGAITLNAPSIDSNGLITASNTLSTTGWIGNAPNNTTLQLSTQSAKTITPNTSDQIAVSNHTYTTGEVRVAPVPTETKTLPLDAASPANVNPSTGKFLSSVTPVIDNSVINAANIVKNATILGIAGTYQSDARLQEKSVTYTANGTYSVFPDDGFDGLSNVNVTVAIPPYDRSVS